MLLFANKARSTLTTSVTSAAGQVATITTGDGGLFVGVGGVATSTTNPMRCVLTAVDANGNDTGAYEIVEVVRSGDNLTLQSRGLDGTTAAAWSAGAVIECRPTAGASEPLHADAFALWPPTTRTGRWYAAHPLTAGIVNNLSANYGGDVAYGGITIHPLMFRRDAVIDRIGVNVSTAGAAGVVTRVGLYTEDPVSGFAGSLLVDSGDMDVSTTGSKEFIYSATLRGGTRYWMAHVTSGACGFYGYTTSSVFNYGEYAFIYTNDCMPWTSAAYGALPADLSAAVWNFERAGSGIIKVGVRGA